VVDDLSGPMFREVLAAWPDLVAVEMESLGTFLAAEDARQRARPAAFATIRGISDLPRDAAKLPAKAISYTTLRAVVKARKTVQMATNGRTYTWYNTNQLLGSYDGAIGIKTGTGTSAGPCLIFAAKRNGRTVVGVLLHSSTSAKRYTDAARMLDYAFRTGSSSTSASTMRLRSLPAPAQKD
jgi:hypothetical protein